MVSYFIYVTKLQLPLSTQQSNAPLVAKVLKDETGLASNLYCWDFYPKPDTPPIQDNAHDLLVLNKGAIVIRLGIHVTIIGFKRQIVGDTASRMGADSAKLNIKRVKINPV
jgi:hypothetical protein